MENAVAIKFKKLSWIASTYYAEGLPYSLVQQVSVQFFTYAGASLQIIGLLSFFGLPWNLKLFWSPVIDLFGNKKTLAGSHGVDFRGCSRLADMARTAS